MDVKSEAAHLKDALQNVMFCGFGAALLLQGPCAGDHTSCVQGSGKLDFIGCFERCIGTFGGWRVQSRSKFALEFEVQREKVHCVFRVPLRAFSLCASSLMRKP